MAAAGGPTTLLASQSVGIWQLAELERHYIRKFRDSAVLAAGLFYSGQPLHPAPGRYMAIVFSCPIELESGINFLYSLNRFSFAGQLLALYRTLNG
jgi:hypothetical protein